VRSAREHGTALTSPGGLLKALTKTVIETALDEEMADHLTTSAMAARETRWPELGQRNGSRTKTVLTDNCGPVEIEVPLTSSGTPQPCDYWPRESTPAS
jgi:putative transposase